MLRYVFNETINKASDFLKFNRNPQSQTTNPSDASHSQSASLADQFDFNNNISSGGGGGEFVASSIIRTDTHSESIDSFDWFKPFNDLVEQTNLRNISNTGGEVTLAQIEQQLLSLHEQNSSEFFLSRPISIDREASHKQILFSLYYDRLIKLYSIGSRNEKRKMHTFMSGLNLNADALDDDVRSFYEASKLNTLADLDMPETVKLFQKSYYKEPIKGQLVNVPSWRMKEKVNFNFFRFNSKRLSKIYYL
jgi:hypothetical protein